MGSYLYHDILAYAGIRKPEVFDRLLQALALQVGGEVNYNELAQTTGLNKGTVAAYLDILEKGYIVFRLSSFARNLRTEIKRTRKIYFYDNGVRNAIIGSFQLLDLRQDKGALWENFRDFVQDTGTQDTGVDGDAQRLSLDAGPRSTP